MKDVFMPYYMNGNNIKNLFQIAITRYGTIDINIATVSTTIELNVPLSEITCGKIVQGSAKIAISRTNVQSEIDFETKASINAFVNLEKILSKNNAIKVLNSPNSLNNLITGDIVELTATIREIDPILNFFEKTLNLLQFQQITENQDNSKMIEWVNNNIDTIHKQKKLKFSATPSFKTDTNITISLDSANSILDPDYYLDRPVTIVGQIMNASYDPADNLSEYEDDYINDNTPQRPPTGKPSYIKDFSKNTIFGESLRAIPLTNHGDTFNLNAHLLWDCLNSNKKYAGFLEHLNYPSDPKLKNKTIEIVPFMIYL